MTDKMQAITQRMDPSLLTKGRVVVIGAGGVGSAMLPHLAVFLNSVSNSVGERITLLICDGDRFEHSNGYRMDVLEQSQNKAIAWESYLVRRHSVLTVRCNDQYVTEANIGEIVREHDLVLLCCDNHATRKLVSDRIGQLQDGTLISGGNDGVTDSTDGTYGTIQVYSRQAGEIKHGSPLDKYHPEISKPADKNPEELDCLEAAQAGDPQLTFANLMVAAMMCNALTGLLMGMKKPFYDEAVFDIRENIANPLRISCNKNIK